MFAEPLAMVAGVRMRLRVAVSIREKLQVPDGWCSSGLSAKE